MKRGQFIVVAVFIGMCGCEHKDTPATVAPATAATTPADVSSDGGTAVTTKSAKLRDAGTPDLAVAVVAPPGALRPEAVRVQRALRAMHLPTMPNGAINRATIIQPAPTVTKPQPTSSPAPAAQKQ